MSFRDGFWIERFDVAMKRNLRPVSFQDCLAVGVNFTMESGFHSRILEAEVKATDSCKEGRKAHLVVVAHC